MAKPSTAAILTGGSSSRMGQEKSRQQLAGRTFLDRIHDVLRERFDDVVLVGAGGLDGYPPPIPDVRPGVGPLGGVATALHHADGSDVFITPVDVPLITVRTVDRLLRPPLLPGQARLARVGGRVQPLVGLYAGDLLPLAMDRVDAEDRSMMAFLRTVPHLTLVDVDEGSLRNINTPEEYADLVADFEG